MKKSISFFLALLLFFPFSMLFKNVADADDSLLTEEIDIIFSKTEAIKLNELSNAYDNNKVKAKHDYIGNEYSFTGFVYTIEDDYVLIYSLAKNDYGSLFPYSIKVPLSIEQIINLSINQVINIVGVIDDITISLDEEGKPKKQDGEPIKEITLRDGCYMNEYTKFNTEIKKVVTSKDNKTSTLTLERYGGANYTYKAKPNVIDNLLSGEHKYKVGDRVTIKAKLNYKGLMFSIGPIEYEITDIESFEEYSNKKGK